MKTMLMGLAMALAALSPAAAQFDDAFTATQSALSFSRDYNTTDARIIGAQVEYSSVAPSNVVIYPWGISTTADTLSSTTAHGLSLGFAVLYSSNAKALGGLSAQTTYYAIPVTNYAFKLSDTSTGAAAGITVDLTSVTDGGVYTFAPIAFATASQTGLQWQGSNDDVTFYDLTTASLSSVTYTVSGGTVASFANYPYAWFRARVLKPTWGGITWTLHIKGKK